MKIRKVKLKRGKASYYIYHIYCTITNMSYIGKSLDFPVTRWRDHSIGSSKSKISDAIREHGIKNFTFAIIDIATTIEELEILERDRILEYDTIWPNGYNDQLPMGYNNLHRDTSLFSYKYIFTKSSIFQSFDIKEILTNFLKSLSLSEITMMIDKPNLIPKKIGELNLGNKMIQNLEKVFVHRIKKELEARGYEIRKRD